MGKRNDLEPQCVASMPGSWVVLRCGRTRAGSPDTEVSSQGASANVAHHRPWRFRRAAQRTQVSGESARRWPSGWLSEKHSIRLHANHRHPADVRLAGLRPLVLGMASCHAVFLAWRSISARRWPSGWLSEKHSILPPRQADAFLQPAAWRACARSPCTTSSLQCAWAAGRYQSPRSQSAITSICRCESIGAPPSADLPKLGMRSLVVP